MGKKSGGGGQTQTTVQKADPWIGVQPHLMDLYGGASTWFHGGNTVSPSNPTLDRSMDMVRARAQVGSGALRVAQNTTEQVARGNYSNPVMSGQMLRDNPFAQDSRMLSNRTAMGSFLDKGNPYLEGMVNAATRSTTEDFMQSIAPALASQFSAAGRTGSGSHVAAFTGATSKLGERLGDMNQNIRGQQYQFERGLMEQAYEAERQRQAMAYEAERSGQRQAWLDQPRLQLQASAMAPGLAQADYLDAQMLQQTGQLQRGIDQELRDEALKRLQAYSGLLQGASGFGTTTSSGSGQQTQPYNKLTGAIGGGLGGYALGSALGAFGPIGAGVGALMGLFG